MFILTGVSVQTRSASSFLLGDIPLPSDHLFKSRTINYGAYNMHKASWWAWELQKMSMAPALIVRKWEDGSSTQVLLQPHNIVNNMKCHRNWERERERSLFELGLKRREAKQRKEWSRTIRKAIRRHSRWRTVGTITVSNPSVLFLLEHATHNNVTCHISNYVTCFVF